MPFVKNLIVAEKCFLCRHRYFFKGSNSTVEDIRLCWVFRRLRHRHSETAATCKQHRDAARVMFIPPPWIVVTFLPRRLALILTAVLPLCDQTAAARRGTLGASSSPFRFRLICRSPILVMAPTLISARQKQAIANKTHWTICAGTHNGD